uniref:Transmembrane protein 63C n=1 Tax=Oncorhynchus kisutch TaxID=8019 RepID=A0A8C7DFL2_ONCKI
MELDVLGFLDSLGEDNITAAERCYRSHSRSSVLQGLPFGGVPTVLAINVVMWMFLLLIFSCLRKAAWDYGRLALLMENDSLTSLFYGEQSEKEKSPSESSPSDSETKDLVNPLSLCCLSRDDEIRSKCGIDATTYLSFQRHIILLMTVVCLLSLAIILPVNFSGNLLGNLEGGLGPCWEAQGYPKRDLRPRPHHKTLPVILCLRLTSLRTQNNADSNTPGPSSLHSSEAYPSCTVTDVRFCFNVHKLMILDLLCFRRKAMKGRLYFATMSQKEGKIMMKIHPCATIFCCDVCGFEQVDAEQYYSELEEKLTDEFNAEKHRISLKRLGIAFVTFRDERMTAVIVKDYSRVGCRRRPKQSSITTVVQSHRWGVGYAPAPSDIIWENLSLCGSRWWLRFVLLNILLFLLLFFLTTPAIIVNTMDKLNVTRPVDSLRSPIITQFFPTLLLWAFSVLLPFIVYYSAFFESHWTRSSENQITMHKCFVLLVFMVIILPSLGLSSLDLFFRWLFDVNFLEDKNIKFECVFLPDNGAFFVNYVITSSLIGTAMELLRIPALMVYALRLCLAKPGAERIHVKRSQAYEFQFGLQYAWTMCIYAVSMTYSITCPIIMPFGLLYLILKHMVDRYNIYYAYVPTKLNQRIHTAAISQVIVAPILCMFWLLFFSVLRLGAYFLLPVVQYSHNKKICMGNISVVVISNLSLCPSPQLFLASVLLEPELGLTPMPSPAHQSYGTMASSQDREEEEEDQVETVETELQETPDPYYAMDSPVGNQ